jgi:hypothetical protein
MYEAYHPAAVSASTAEAQSVVAGEAEAGNAGEQPVKE